MDPKSDLDEERTAPGGQAEKALDILEWLARADGPKPKLTEITAGTGIAKATAHRLLSLLRQRGYVDQDAQAGYALGLKCFELGEQWNRRFDLRVFARPHLERLVAEHNETVQLAVYDQGDVVYIDRIESTQLVIARSDSSSRAPVSVIATGRVLLAYQSAAEIEVQLERPLPMFTPASPDRAQLAELLEEVRVQGYAMSEETFREGICGVAAPIRNSTGAVIAAVGVIMPKHRYATNKEMLRDAVIATAVDISATIGGPDVLVTSARRT